MFDNPENQKKWEEYQLELVRLEVEKKKLELQAMQPKQRVITREEQNHSPWIDLNRYAGTYGGYLSDGRSQMGLKGL